MAKTSVSDEEVRGEFDRRTKKVTEDDGRLVNWQEEKTNRTITNSPKMCFLFFIACTVLFIIPAIN